MSKKILAKITWAMIGAVLLCGLFTWYQAFNLEAGILDVCAAQQDAYVQLVLDQINLKQNRDDEEIINEILNTLDASTNKYWTFSKDKDMLFVKDVVETNRYKGITTISYYDSESAKAFLEALEVDQVIHKNIRIQGKDYIASGVAFEYNGESYRLCLLTNKQVILNSNKFMVAEIETIILIGAMMTLILAVPIYLARKIEVLFGKNKEQEELIANLQESVGQLNDLLNQREHYDTRNQVWSKDVFESFLDKLKAKGVKRIILAKVHCENADKRNRFVEKATILVDKKILRFAWGEQEVMLLAVQMGKEDVERNLEMLTKKGVSLAYISEENLKDTEVNQLIQKLEIEV